MKKPSGHRKGKQPVQPGDISRPIYNDIYIYIYYLLPWPLSVLGGIATQELYIKSQELYIIYIYIYAHVYLIPSGNLT